MTEENYAEKAQGHDGEKLFVDIKRQTTRQKKD
jgi:hypothetical protein